MYHLYTKSFHCVAAKSGKSGKNMRYHIQFEKKNGAMQWSYPIGIPVTPFLTLINSRYNIAEVYRIIEVIEPVNGINIHIRDHWGQTSDKYKSMRVVLLGKDPFTFSYVNTPKTSHPIPDFLRNLDGNPFTEKEYFHPDAVFYIRLNVLPDNFREHALRYSPIGVANITARIGRYCNQVRLY